MYTPRIGRFFSVDPLKSKYPWYTPYQFTGNTPIANIDLDGAEPKPAINGTQEGESQQTTERVFRARGSYVAEKTWYWHAGSKDYGTKPGWYESDEYQKVLSPIAEDLAGYQNLYAPGTHNSNWTGDQKANVANSKLGQFIATGLTDNAAKHLIAEAKNVASERNFNASGTTYPSNFNVEDMVGVGVIFKEGLKALGVIA